MSENNSIPTLPLPGQDDNSGNPAADLIRQRLKNIYAEEPDAKEEEKEIEQEKGHLSKHQEYMRNLSMSGKSLAEIQAAWHSYYQGLSDKDKHEVWQEFYSAHDRSNQVQAQSFAHTIERPAPQNHTRKTRTVADVRKHIVDRTRSKGKLKARHHLQSLMFGIGMGSLVIFILLFGFFNERIIAPFIQPSRTVSSTPIIIDPNSDNVSKNPEIIIPKINVEIPVIYSEHSISDTAVENALEDGVLHYPTTVNPGELGNAAFFGHSSNNIFNKGKYKFAFVLLKRLENGDLFYLTKNGKRYTYQVYDKKIVKPENVSVLGATSKPATATLITCDPPGTSINRLVVYGVQISPDPAKNSVSHINTSSSVPKVLPSNSPSLWSRLINWLAH